MEETVSRYKDVVKEWEIWNEPRHSESPEAYANLLIRTSETIKKTQPDAIIIGFTVPEISTRSMLAFKDLKREPVPSGLIGPVRIFYHCSNIRH